MAIGEETLIDAPITPAPVFAYRALRAVFLGEQDTPEPAVRVSNKSAPKEEHEEEVRSNRPRPNVNLTPNNKRKHSALFHPSPSKSILRTPGAHTPRRALLKDVNVTFKDLRKSVSPDLTRNKALRVDYNTQAGHDKENQATEMSITKVAAKEVDSKLVPKQRLPRINEQNQDIAIAAQIKAEEAKNQATPTTQQPTEPVVVPATTSIATNFDADAFMRTTEKEMKKLIKYGQRMRECARRRETENAKLQLMLEELRSENKRLKKQLESTCCNKGPTRSSKTSIHEDAAGHRNSIHKPSTTAPQLDSTKWSSKFDLLDLDDILSPKPNYTDTITRSKRPVHNPSTSNPKSTSTHSQPSDQLPPQPKDVLTNPNPPSNATSNPPKSNPPQRSQSLHIPVPLPLRPITNNTPSSRIGPDRLAAARARVRQKAELRKASTESEGGVHIVGADKAVASAVGKENRVDASLSLVDWADL